MRRVLFVLVLLLVLGFRGDVSGQERSPPQRAVVFPFRTWSLSQDFKANQRACFVAVGSGATYLGGYVYDGNGNCVAWDDHGSSATRDDIALVWYPSRGSRYTIEIQSLGMRRNRFEYAVRP